MVHLIDDIHEARNGVELVACCVSAMIDIYGTMVSRLTRRGDLAILTEDAERPAVQCSGRRRHTRCPAAEILEYVYILEFDGASKGNPGRAGAGALLLAPASHGGGVAWAGHSYVGDNTTNNVVEYNAAIIGIRAALRAGNITSLHCRGDSMLVVRHATGRWAARNPSMRALLTTLTSALAEFGGCPGGLATR